jgi:hypothetical protein
MNAMEHVRGKGRAKNPLDGDDITVELSVRDGRVITIGVNQVRDRYVMIIGNGAQAIAVNRHRGQARPWLSLDHCPSGVAAGSSGTAMRLRSSRFETIGPRH